MKDPAFLFYPNDFAAGTMLLNEHQIGCYIKLLIAQFNNGPLNIEDIKLVLGSNFATWPRIQSKFCLYNERYYNKRLNDEMTKRSNFTASRRSNRLSKSYVPTTEGHMEDVNEDINNKFIYGEFKNVNLTAKELEKLNTRFGENNTKILIEELSRYITSIGKDKYKSHYATIITWGQKKIVEHSNKLTKGKQII